MSTLSLLPPSLSPPPSSQPVNTLYNPQKGPVYAPVGDDLTTLDDNRNVAGGGGDAQIGGSGL